MDTSYTEPTSAENHTLIITEQIRYSLNETRRWTKFLSIMGFIGIGLIVLLALFIGSILNFVASMSPTPFQFPTFFITFIYLVIALLYFFPVFYLYRFSTKMEIALRDNDETELASSFENLKAMFKYIGIMTIVVMSIYLLIIIGVGLAFMFFRH